MTSPRSYLFARGHDRGGVAEALSAGADAVILDLEDGVPAPDKQGARRIVADVARHDTEDAQCEVHVRINRSGDGSFDQDDAAAVVSPGIRALRLPKVEDPQAVRQLNTALSAMEDAVGLPRGHTGLYLTIETAAGVLAAPLLATSSDRIQRMVLGPHDLCADLGEGTAIPDEHGTLVSRALLVLASRAAGLPGPADGASAVDDATLRRRAERARDMGFHGKSAASPQQVPILHHVFPSLPA